MTMPQSGAQYAQPMSLMEFVDFRLAASACVVMPIAPQTTAVIAITRPIVMLSPRGWARFGGLTSKTGRIEVAQPKNYTGPEGPRLVGPMPALGH